MREQVDSKKITWVIKNFSSIPLASINSDQFVVGCCKWRLRAYPKGDKKQDSLSLFLEVHDEDSLPIECRRHAKFSLTVVNQISEKLSKVRETQQWFEQKSPAWGYSEMITLTELNDKKGFIVNGEVIVVAKIDVIEVVGRLDVSEESLFTIDVHGFQVLPSQVESVKRLFERDLDIAAKFRQKNPYLKTAYMNVLLSLTQMLCQSPQELSDDAISGAEAALAYLKEAGFKLDWLKKKLDDLKEKKKKEEACLVRLREIDEQLTPLKKKCLDMEAQIDKEKDSCQQLELHSHCTMTMMSDDLRVLGHLDFDSASC